MCINLAYEVLNMAEMRVAKEQVMLASSKGSCLRYLP